MKSYGPAHRLDDYDMHEIICTWYYTSCCIWHTWNQTSKCCLKYTPDCTWLHTPSLLDLHSQVSSQEALNHTLRRALKYTPNCTRWHSPSVLDYTLQSQVSTRSQSHSQGRTQVHCQLHLIRHSPHTWLYASEYALKTLSITLPVCLALSSPLCSQDSLNRTSDQALKYTSTSSRWHTPSLLNYTLPSKVSIQSQEHLQLCT